MCSISICIEKKEIIIIIWFSYVSQVNDFLSGKAPLNLTMRLGDHMMLIQLQLSTVSSSGSSKRLQTAASTVASTGAVASALSASTVAPEPPPPQATATAATACSAGNIIGTPRLIPGVDAYPITRVRNVSDDSDDNSMDTSEDAPPERSMTPPPLAVPAPVVEQPAPAVTPSAPSPAATASCSCDASTSTASTTTATAAGDKPQLDTRALAEASRNLTQTLKQLSSEVLTTKSGSKEVSVGFGTWSWRKQIKENRKIYRHRKCFIWRGSAGEKTLIIIRSNLKLALFPRCDILVVDDRFEFGVAALGRVSRRLVLLYYYRLLRGRQRCNLAT